jgi:hypothetical protein
VKFTKFLVCKFIGSNFICIIYLFFLQNEMEMEEQKPPSYQSTLQPTAPPGDNTRRALRGPLGAINNALNFVEDSIRDFISKQKTIVKIIAAVIVLILYIIYFCFAVSIDAERAADLIYLTAFGFFCFFYWFIKKFFGKAIWNGCMKPIKDLILSRRRILTW